MKTKAIILFTLAFSTLHAEQPPYSWRGIEGSGVFPAKDLVTEFCDLAPDMVTSAKDSQGREKKLTLPAAPGSKKNIVWRTTLPHWGSNAPVVVKERVFVICDEGWKHDAPVLVCLDAADGKILWQKEVDHLDAWPADKAKVGKECRSKEIARYSKFMTWWNRLYWDNDKNGWATKPEYGGKMLGPGQPLNRAAAPKSDLLAQAKTEGLNMPEKWRIGVSGGWRSRYGLNEDSGNGKANYEACVKNRYYWYPGWSSEGPYFGSTMGSVVSDGEAVYAVTALDGAACFDLQGNRKWVTDLEGGLVRNYPASMPMAIQNHMSSPILADDKLVYYHRDGGVMYGLDTATGKIAWKTQAPLGAKVGKDGERERLGYQGHMGPGGTPVAMKLGATTVVVSGHGMVVRVSDGKLLGQVKLPKGTLINKDKGLVDAEEDHFGASYGSWVAHDEVLFYAPFAGLYAVRLRLEGETIAEEVLWRLDGTVSVSGGGPNLVYYRGGLYAQASKEKRRGVAQIEPTTGKIVTWGPTSGGHDTGLAFGTDLAVWPTGYTGDRTEGKSNPAATPGHGMTTYTIVALPGMKVLGAGYLCPEAPAGEVRDRHIARIGTARVVWGNAGTTCWGNRIFIRNNDYLWCIGDPARPFVPPEAVQP